MAPTRSRRIAAVSFFFLANLIVPAVWAQAPSTDTDKGSGKQTERAAKKPSGSAVMPTAPAPKSGSMPRTPAPRGKLGTEPTSKGKLGTDPKPGEPQSRPPRPD